MKSTDKIHLLRLFAFIGIIAVAVGSRLYSGGLCSVWRNGTYTVYGAHDEETVYDRIPILGVRGVYERIDTRGGEQTALDMLENRARRWLEWKPSERQRYITRIRRIAARVSKPFTAR